MGKAWLIAMAAVLGIFSGHQVTYERAAAGAGEHAGMTLATQNWLPSLPAVLAVVSLGVFLLALLRRAIPAALGRPAVVMALQAATFVAIELLDRAIHGCCLYPSTVVGALGLLAQALPAFLVYAFLAVAVPRALNRLASVLTISVLPLVRRMRMFVSALVLTPFSLTYLLPSRAPPVTA